MTYNRKIMRLELSAENPVLGGYYYAELLLPATDYEVKDGMQRTRAVGRENTVEVSILECDILPELQDIRLDTFSLDELNFFAKRLSFLPNEELPVFYAVTEQIFNDADENPVSIKDLINCTYGLDTVPVAHNVSNLSELGRFAFENELLSDLEDIPESAVPFLNAEQIGRVQQKNDNGVFEGRLYIPTVHYDRPEIYDGVTLPEEEPETSDFAIRLLVSGTPEHIKGDPVDRAIWLDLPMASDILANYAAAFNEADIVDCVYYDFESIIPQITSEMFGINGLLTDEGILKNGSKFENISVFQNGSLTNILFPFEDGVEIDMGKLAMWRLHSHEQFGGTWLSDYVPNRLGGFITEHEPDKIKPDCRLIGEDGNIFNLMGLAARTLRHNGLTEQATEMTGRIHECGSYDEALCIIGEYVNITGSEESEDENEGMGMRL